MKRLVLGGVTLLMFGAAVTAAPLPLVYKAPPPLARVVRTANPVNRPNLPRENELFERFLGWLKRSPR